MNTTTRDIRRSSPTRNLCRGAATTIMAIGMVVVGLVGCTPDESKEIGPGIPTKEASSLPTENEPSAEPTKESKKSPEPEEVKTIETRTVRVIDGDTIVVAPVEGLKANSDQEHVVRLLGIDAPEMNYRSEEDPECGAQQATDHLAEMLPSGSTIFITYDPVADETDRYDRSLAYVSNAGMIDLNEQMAKDGWAAAWYPRGEPEPTRFPAYEKAGQQAENNGLGAYASCDSIGR